MDSFHLASNPAVAKAIEAAGACSTMDELRAAIAAYDAVDTARGQPPAPAQASRFENPIMIVAEKPERLDLETGVPFSGAHGDLFREVCRWYDFAVEDAHVEYALHWASEDDRSPNATQISASRPFLYRAIELVRPRAIIAQGRGVLESLFMYRGSVLEIVGHTMAFRRGDLAIQTLATLHPAYALRVPIAKWSLAEQMETALELFGHPDGRPYVPNPLEVKRRAA